MEDACNVPLPIKFNCWKHHARFIKQELMNFKSEVQIKTLQTTLLIIGESQMDLYHGLYSPKETANQVIKHLVSISIKNKREYSTWLYADGKEYKNITLKDDSVWTLRSGDDEIRYVHIHPGRYSPHTVRVKALTLKTAICVLAYSNIKPASVFDIDFINKIRKIYLNASPLKSVSVDSGLGKLMVLLNRLTE